jgi:hypothetical protein
MFIIVITVQTNEGILKVETILLLTMFCSLIHQTFVIIILRMAGRRDKGG